LPYGSEGHAFRGTTDLLGWRANSAGSGLRGGGGSFSERAILEGFGPGTHVLVGKLPCLALREKSPACTITRAVNPCVIMRAIEILHSGRLGC
jgi:hypothetical protein